MPNSVIGPLGDLGSPLGPSRPPSGPSLTRSEGTLGAQRPTKRTLMLYVVPPTFDFHVFVPFCMVRQNNLCRNVTKTNLILTFLKMHFSLRFLLFSSQAVPRAAPRRMLESDLATLGSQGPPLKFGNGPLGALDRSEGSFYLATH